MSARRKKSKSDPTCLVIILLIILLTAVTDGVMPGVLGEEWSLRFIVCFLLVAFLAFIWALLFHSKPKTGEDPESAESDSIQEDADTNNDNDNEHGINREYFDECLGQATRMLDYLKRTNGDKDFVDFVMGINCQKSIDEMDDNGGINHRLFIFFIVDFLKVYSQLGHTLDPKGKEILTLGLFMNLLLKADDLISYSNLSQLYSNLMPYTAEVLTVFSEATDPSMEGKYDFYYPWLYEMYDPDLIHSYKTLLHSFASVVAKADGNIGPEESEYISGLLTKEHEDAGDLASATAADELNSLIGLARVKDEVSKLTNFIKIQQLREKEGLKTSAISCHCIFTGNPGTGKTTVARIIARIYKELGILKKGHLIETDRSGLVAEYVGQTAVKTNKVIDSALDGVLFIDEAYTLVSGSANDYGHEAISTLLKRMEDDRDRLVVILAGYSAEMKRFIDSNPGLQSRFNRYIQFDDYTASELVDIFMLKTLRLDYTLSEDALAVLKSVVEKAVREKDNQFGNARYIRNLFEKTLENQASRLASESSLTKNLLQEITAEDIAKS